MVWKIPIKLTVGKTFTSEDRDNKKRSGEITSSCELLLRKNNYFQENIYKTLNTWLGPFLLLSLNCLLFLPEYAARESEILSSVPTVVNCLHLKIELLWKLFRRQQWSGPTESLSLTEINGWERSACWRLVSHYNPEITLGSLIPIDNYTIYWYIDNWTWCRHKANYLRGPTLMDQLGHYNCEVFFMVMAVAPEQCGSNVSRTSIISGQLSFCPDSWSELNLLCCSSLFGKY